MTRSDFAEFFLTVHGTTPFSWQERLLAEVLDEGWVSTISIPTGSGKTAVMDVAVFALALEAELPTEVRKTPRRIALTVDRRIVVDDAHQRAKRIVEALRQPATPLMDRIANRLHTYGGELPLDCAALRGGIYREDRWARTPSQPVILCSTVDQVGSRLLHRGYGLSPRAWPIHAGLLGHDTLVILDEAHCAQPFSQTLAAVQLLKKKATEVLPGPWAVVEMTATPRNPLRSFELTPEERDEAPLAARLTAHKLATLKLATKKGDAGVVDAALAALTEHDTGLLGPGKTTLIVVNRVKAARAIYDELSRRAADARGGFNGHVILLTGRSRPVERDALLAEWRHRLMAGRKRESSAQMPPLVCVATQCVEVGADLDVDAMVTEVAALDSLRQRFGRLDRLGQLGTTKALILARPEYVGDSTNAVLPRELDPVYGAALTKTWWWLQSVASARDIDFGPSAFDEILAAIPPAEPLVSLAAEAPHLFPVYCDLWAQTGPTPAVSPDPGVFLHGPQTGPADVGVVWRSDLEESARAQWTEIVTLAPPTAGEVLPMPLHAVRSWLAGEDADPGSDLEGAATLADDNLPQATKLALLWAGPELSALVNPAEIPPGATIVVPSAYGGADRMGWTGRLRDIPNDLMEPARLGARRPAVLRVHPSVEVHFEGKDPPENWQQLANLSPDEDEGLPGQAELRNRLLPALHAWAEMAPALAPSLLALLSDSAARVQPHPSGRGLILSASRRLAEDARDFSDEDDLSSLVVSGAISLTSHLEDVRLWAERIAKQAGLPEPLVHALATAGHLHDLGKADPRFQAWLVGGDLWAVDPQEPLAKSARLRAGRASIRARELAGYPPGARHELLSVRMAESAPGLLPALPILRDLVLHLVASHHGHCRPWAPAVSDLKPLNVHYQHGEHHLEASSATALEHAASGVAERFWRLLRHYGWWGLSFLEACMRLADHRASERPGLGQVEMVE